MAARLRLAVLVLLSVRAADAYCKRNIPDSNGKNCEKMGPASPNRKKSKCVCFAGYCAVKGLFGYTCRAQVPDSSCKMWPNLCYKGGLSTCHEGRCLCLSGWFVGGDGKCQAGRNGWPVCKRSQDTGGTCSHLDCDESRGPTFCIGGKCLCKGNTCERAGRCAPPGSCHADTGGTCGTLSWCDSSRGKTDCQGGKCFCKKGLCAEGGKCVYPEQAGLLVNTSTVLSDSYGQVDPEVARAEYWEVTLNLAKGAALAGFAMAVVTSGALMAYRFGRRRSGGSDSARTLTTGAGTELVQAGAGVEAGEVVN